MIAALQHAMQRAAERTSRQFEPRRSSGARASTWDPAATDRLYEDWVEWTRSPEFETRYAFRQVRARSRAMARNNPWIAGFLDELANNVVGAQGILIEPAIMSLLGELDRETNQVLSEALAEWSNPEFASADGHDSFVELQRQIIQTIAVDGECFVRRVRGAANPFGYELQFIDADLVDDMYNIAALPNGNRIRMGVEVDKRNRAVAYHVYTRYAEDISGEPYERRPIPASEILHLFVRWHRSNLPRGIPWLAPVLTRMRHESEYEINHLVASRGGASKMAFILNKQPQAIEAFEPPKKGEKPRVFDMQAGVIPELLPGQELATFDPTFPSIAYEQYVMAVLRAVARGLKVSYMTLTGDLRQANYGSQRAGLQPERDRWRGLQVWLAVHGIRVIWRDLVDMMALKQSIPLRSRLGSDYYAANFHGRGWQWIDPVSDLKAAQLEIALGLSTRTDLAAQRGKSFERNVDVLKTEQNYARIAGVDVSGAQVSVSVAKDGTDASGAGSDSSNTESDNGDSNASGSGPRLAAVG